MFPTRNQQVASLNFLQTLGDDSYEFLLSRKTINKDGAFIFLTIRNCRPHEIACDQPVACGIKSRAKTSEDHIVIDFHQYKT